MPWSQGSMGQPLLSVRPLQTRAGAEGASASEGGSMREGAMGLLRDSCQMCEFVVQYIKVRLLFCPF